MPYTKSEKLKYIIIILPISSLWKHLGQATMYPFSLMYSHMLCWCTQLFALPLVGHLTEPQSSQPWRNRYDHDFFKNIILLSWLSPQLKTVMFSGWTVHNFHALSLQQKIQVCQSKVFPVNSMKAHGSGGKALLILTFRNRASYI